MNSDQEEQLKEIEKLSQEGSMYIAASNPTAAVSIFSEALRKSQLAENEHSVRVCSCNLGSVYILLGDTKNAIKYLQMGLPQNGTSYDSDSFYLNGDVYYNIGLAYLIIKDYNKAIDHLKLSIENFNRIASKQASSAEAHALLAQAYDSISNYSLGASEYKKTAEIFSELQEDYKSVKALINQATCLYHDLQIDSCLVITKKCLPVCKCLQQDTSTGKLYHDLGILFARTNSSSEAIDCFKTALKLLPISTNGPHEDHKRLKYRASCLQHIGELLNIEQHYHESLHYHKEAARLLSVLNNSKAVGRCFASLAYAYAQLHDYLKAERAYHNALQKMEEIGDLHGQCLSYESLADVNCEEQDINRAIFHYKQASSIAQHIDIPQDVHDRILHKLSNVLECQVSGAVRATLNGHRRRPVSLSRTKFEIQSINSTPVHSMFAQNRVVPQRVDIPTVRPPVQPAYVPMRNLSHTRKASPQRNSHRKKKVKKGRRRSGAVEMPVPQGVVSYESESELSSALQALAMDSVDDNLTENASSSNEYGIYETSKKNDRSSLPDVDVSSTSRPGSVRKKLPPQGNPGLYQHSDDVTSSDDNTQTRLNRTRDDRENDCKIVNNSVHYAQVNKHKSGTAPGSVVTEEKLYETLNSGLEATVLLGSSMPIRDPPSPPPHSPPALPPRHSLRHAETSHSSSSETDEEDSSDDDDDSEVSYKTYEQPQFMKQLSRGQREKGLYQIALRKSYSQTFVDGVKKVQENNRNSQISARNSLQNPSEIPSSSTTSMRSSGSEMSTRSTMSTKSKACSVM